MAYRMCCGCERGGRSFRLLMTWIFSYLINIQLDVEDECWMGRRRKETTLHALVHPDKPIEGHYLMTLRLSSTNSGSSFPELSHRGEKCRRRENFDDVDIKVWLIHKHAHHHKKGERKIWFFFHLCVSHRCFDDDGLVTTKRYFSFNRRAEGY
jgi:hypothetical protein